MPNRAVNPKLKVALSVTLILMMYSAVVWSAQSRGRGAPDPLHVDVIVGSEGKGYYTGAGVPAGNPPVFAARDGAVPDGIEPLPVDIFSSHDFYRDQALWLDKRYYRCNSPVGLEQIWGAYEVPLIGDNPPITAAWGFCDRDYPRAEIVSPYPFKSAAEHYRALLDEARSHGGPTRHTAATLPAWTGQYQRQREKTATWYHGAILQIPTYLSLLTPEYQRRFVQQMYHYAATNASQWPGSYCWPEGFMRRFAQYGGARVNMVVSPGLVLDMRVAAQTVVTEIHVGREFNESGAVPRLGPDVPQWLGETIGFWDGDTLITWTANLQGWISHGGFEYTNNMQSLEMYSPTYDGGGKFTGLRHETVLYDDQVFVEPVRIVHYLAKLDDATTEPFPMVECVAHMYPMQGRATPVNPGQNVQFIYPNMHDRPWADIWQRYYEQDMERPQDDDIFTFE
ncbi:MAG: hypothetical protein H6978_15200 [Gammaproteobacteria bacterium]|nr:hypothetical protein [Gammaproteobacteria bacterium]